MEAYEWAYWMERKAATQDIKDRMATCWPRPARSATVAATKARMGGIACWDVVMDENNYMVQKWNEFVAA